MAKTAKINVTEGNLLASLQGFFKAVLRVEDISAILVPQHLPMKNMVMPALVTDPKQLEGADPLAPAFPMNAAKIASRLTRKPAGGKVAAVLRPCEIRAFIELVKLKQGRMENVLLVGIDCLGAYQNKDYFKFVGDNVTESTTRFYQNVLSGKGAAMKEVDLSPTCKACEHCIPGAADLGIGLFGVDTANQLLVQTQTPQGEELLTRLNLPGSQEPAGRQKAVNAIIAEKTTYRDNMYQEIAAATNSLEKLTTYLANCVNCYNCRVACPVCYCKECVFVTDVFNHEPIQYLRWANKKGVIKMPTDTVFYHLTRMAHMSTACIGCGQCSNACPNDIQVMELFRAVSSRTQEAFEYQPGRSIEEEPPLSVFREDELADIVGIGHA
jgi:formate dehydrogenase subunit beta